MVWNIIKKAIHDIEMNNDLRFGNESWERLKQMEKEILAWQYKLEEELKEMYETKGGVTITVNATEEPTQVFSLATESVTLTDDEINWLGLNYVPMSDDFRVYPAYIALVPHCVIQLGETKNGMIRFQLRMEKRTEANLEAIVARRKAFLGE